MFYVHTYLWYIDIKVGINLSIYTCYTFLEMGDQVRYDCEVTIDKFYKNIYHIYMGALMSTFSVSGLSEHFLIDNFVLQKTQKISTKSTGPNSMFQYKMCPQDCFRPSILSYWVGRLQSRRWTLSPAVQKWRKWQWCVVYPFPSLCISCPIVLTVLLLYFTNWLKLQS